MSEANIQPIIISFLSYNKIRRCIKSFYRLFPKKEIIVFNNNPLPGSPRWTIDCEKEAEWLKSHKIRCIESPTRHIHRGSNYKFINSNIQMEYYPYNNHGLALDYTVSWCKENSIESVLLLEPDCWITKTDWYYQSVEEIEKGYYVTGQAEQIIECNHLRKKEITKEYVLQMAGSIWSVNQVTESFQIYPIIDDPPIRKIIDTGQRLFLKHYYLGKAKILNLDGFHHFWHGSKKEGTFYNIDRAGKI